MSCPFPESVTIEGRYCEIQPLDIGRHAESLYAAATAPGMEDRYRYLPGRPPADFDDFKSWIRSAVACPDRVYFAVIDKRSGKAQGRCALTCIDAANGAVEFGDVQWGPALVRTRVATEAFYLISAYIFGLGYRRYVWRIDDRNLPSRRAAERLGFKYEGTFRQHQIVKEDNRNTTWFSIIDSEWPEVRAELERWLQPQNFDTDGTQKTRLDVP